MRTLTLIQNTADHYREKGRVLLLGELTSLNWFVCAFSLLAPRVARKTRISGPELGQLSDDE